MSNDAYTPSYSDVSMPDSQSAINYPFMMQPYPATNFPSSIDDYPIGGLDDPMSNSWTADEPEPSVTSPPRPAPRQQQQQQQSAPVMPDAVLNMAAKVGSDKKPFAYIADVNDIRQQRDKVRRKYVIHQ